MSRIELSKKRYPARLSNENDVIEAWLMERGTDPHPSRVSHTYRFAYVKDNVLRLYEVVSQEDGELTEPDTDDLRDIAVKLIQDDVALLIEDDNMHKVAELSVI